MAVLSTSAIIVIVIVACLFAVSMGAALFKQYYPDRSEDRYHYSPEQQQYMRSIRMKTMGHFRRESMMKDIESGYGVDTASSR
ncbi:hypothetical protein BDV59DRAFT_172831 [Aspergillus ambiguus]|uniref:uncharacterized protein n=1 Tax=Aspergillus ambiguus TaxID=176160 RepID=UPI003CCD7CEF